MQLYICTNHLVWSAVGFHPCEYSVFEWWAAGPQRGGEKQNGPLRQQSYVGLDCVWWWRGHHDESDPHTPVNQLWKMGSSVCRERGPKNLIKHKSSIRIEPTTSGTSFAPTSFPGFSLLERGCLRAFFPPSYGETHGVNNAIQLFRERLSEKVHAAIPKGIGGGFEFTVLQRNLKELVRKAMEMCLRVLKKSNKSSFNSYSRQEQCIDHIPYYLSRLSRAHFFWQPFLK